MKTIVVGTDGSATATGAVTKAAELAAALGATLHVACVAQLGRDLAPIGSLAMLPIPASYDQEVIDVARSAATQAAEAAGRIGASSEVHVLEGEAAHALVSLCDQLDADLLVVGSRGMSGAARFLLGSVPNRCAHHAHCSVMIVRTT